jgi:hypothetical protein
MTMTDTSPLLAFQLEGEPVGRIEEIAGFQTYVSDPPPAARSTATDGLGGRKKVLLFFADVYGPFYGTAKLLQDYFAGQGAFAIIFSFSF